MTEQFVLGISALFHDSAAALVCDTTIVAAAQEERFTRRKGDSTFPRNAIAFCLGQLPRGAALDAVAFYENPLLKMDRIVTNALQSAPRGALIWRQTLRTLKELTWALPAELREVLDRPECIYFPAHHRSHAAAAFYPAPFTRAAVLVVDGVGEWSTTSIWAAGHDTLEPVAEIKFPHSLGLFYSAFTQYCGFKVNSGEYKLMGLAPFGRPVYRRRILDEVLDLKPDGSFALNLKYFAFRTAASTISPLLGMWLGQPAREPREAITQHYMDVAASVQSVTDSVMEALARSALRLTGVRQLCLAGGVALNCVSNTKLLRGTPGLEDLWIQPAAGDAGAALGAALEVACQRKGAAPKPLDQASGERVPADGMGGAYLGPQYTDAEIQASLEASGLTFQKCSEEDELSRLVVDALASGGVVGHFNGRMEFGPRALGNRSILADPRAPAMLERVNAKVKFREGWRPFAPIVIEQEAKRVFEEPVRSPYMLLVSRLKPPYRKPPNLAEARARGTPSLEKLQAAVSSDWTAVTHVDYSSRLQTVNAQSNPRVYRILRGFYERTGCPLLLNTSFNVRGEPIVCAPKHAIDCFLNADLDLLVLGPFVVLKSAQQACVRRKLGSTRFDAD